MSRRIIDRLLLIIGIVCLGIYIGYTVQAHVYQHQLDESFEDMVRQPEAAAPYQPSPALRPKKVRVLNEGDLVGKLEIPRLDVSVMVMEGITSRTLRLAAGHIPGTPVPGDGGNAGIAAHRDSFFRELSHITVNDRIRFQTPEKTVVYRVVSTDIVQPKEVDVLAPTAKDTITLVTCYPFYYIGPAPKRFIVRATAD